MDIDERLQEIDMLIARKSPSAEEKFRLIDMLRGLTAGGLSMCDGLLEERRQERDRELAKEGW